MKTAKRLTSLLLSLTLVLSLAACGGNDDPPSGASGAPDPGVSQTTPAQAVGVSRETDTPQYGGDLVIYFQEFANDFDPSIGDRRNYALWYEPLFVMDWARADASDVFTTEYMTMDWMTGQIADSYTFENGDLTVKLREDVFFQDKEPYNGRQLTAGDVKWTYDRLLGTGSGWDTPYECESPWPMTLDMVESIECPDDFTVVFHFNTESEVALNNFIVAQVCIGGPEWDALTDEQRTDWRYAAGTGPYILEEYVPDNYMRFVRNENYYDHDERHPENKLPYADSVTLKIISDSTQTQTQFMAGNLDVVAWGGNVFSNTEIELLRDGMDPAAYVEYTYNSSAPSVSMKQTVEPFQDIRVRKAMQLAVNLEEVYAQYFGWQDKELDIPGIFATVTQFSSADDWSQELKDSYYTYDPEQAKTLMAEAGYADGFTFETAIFSAMDPDLYALIASYLKEINVTMNVKVASSPVEMRQLGLDPNSQVCIGTSAGVSRLQMLQACFAIDGSDNAIKANDAKLEELLNAFMNAQTMDEQEQAGKALDTYYAEQHYGMFISGAEVISCFISGRIGGYYGERLWKNWNANQILPRLWING